MIIITIILYILLIYVIISLFLIFMLTNNIFYFRNRNYTLPFGEPRKSQFRKELKKPKRVYWICKNNSSDEKWVVLLHSWGRNAARMITRAEIYWKRGYSLLFIDARSHGKSQFVPLVTGLGYGEDVVEVLAKEKIKDPIIHGLSFGSIATTFYLSKTQNAKAAVMEALLGTYRDMFTGFLRTVPYIPNFLFGWIPILLYNGFEKKMHLKFEDLNPYNLLKDINIPMLIIHGEKDEMFPVSTHLNLNKSKLSDKGNIEFWLVQNSPHSRMARFDGYSEKINSFIDQIES